MRCGLHATARISPFSRSETDLERLLPKLHEVKANEGQKFCTTAADLTRPADLEHAVDRALIELGSIDILVNNAATQGPIGPLEHTEFGRNRAIPSS